MTQEQLETSRLLALALNATLPHSVLLQKYNLLEEVRERWERPRNGLGNDHDPVAAWEQLACQYNGACILVFTLFRVEEVTLIPFPVAQGQSQRFSLRSCSRP